MKAKVASLVSGISLIANLGLAKAVIAEEFNPNGWPTPDIASAKFIREVKEDIITEIPGKETLQTIYKTPEGTYFNSLSVKGRIYGFFVDTDGESPMEYMLIDMTL